MRRLLGFVFVLSLIAGDCLARIVVDDGIVWLGSGWSAYGYVVPTVAVPESAPHYLARRAAAWGGRSYPVGGYTVTYGATVGNGTSGRQLMLHSNMERASAYRQGRFGK